MAMCQRKRRWFNLQREGEAKKNIMIESFNIDDNQRALIDPDNAFWAIVRRNAGGGLPSNFYSSVKDKLDKQLKDFRFSRELTAVYIDPTDRCNANCPYCYFP